LKEKFINDILRTKLINFQKKIRTEKEATVESAEPQLIKLKGYEPVVSSDHGTNPSLSSGALKVRLNKRLGIYPTKLVHRLRLHILENPQKIILTEMPTPCYARKLSLQKWDETPKVLINFEDMDTLYVTKLVEKHFQSCGQTLSNKKFYRKMAILTDGDASVIAFFSPLIGESIEFSLLLVT